MDREEILKQSLRIIRRHLPGGDYRILLFGSWAKGSAQETSDIDIGILGAQPVDDLLLIRLRDEIRGIPTLRRIDVVDLSQTDDTFRKEVLSYARAL